MHGIIYSFKASSCCCLIIFSFSTSSLAAVLGNRDDITIFDSAFMSEKKVANPKSPGNFTTVTNMPIIAATA